MKKTIFILILLAIFAFLSSTVFAEDIPQEREPFKYKLMVPLPTPSGTVSTTTGIVDYIKTLYFFAIGLSGIIAMSLIVIAGFQWATAAGKMSTITQAKSRISNAIFGLVILLASYLILNTINPALVNLKEPYIYFIKWTEPFEDPGGTGTTPGDLKSQLEDACHNHGNQCACARLDANKGGNYGEITNCWDYPAGIAYCESNPCGASTYGCYNTAGGCDTFDDFCTQPLPHTCGGGYDQFSSLRAKEIGCKTDPCGWGTSCTWGTAGPMIDRCY